MKTRLSMIEKFLKSSLLLMASALMVLCVASNAGAAPSARTDPRASSAAHAASATTIPLAAAYSYVTGNEAKSISLDTATNKARIVLKNGKSVSADIPAGDMTKAENFFITSGTPFVVTDSTKPLPAPTPTGSVLPFLLIVGALGGLIAIGAAVRKRYAQEMAGSAAAGAKSDPGKKAEDGLAVIPETRFTDVAGVDEAVMDLSEVVQFLRDPERFASVGAVMPKGALLCGPPGTGKTLLARAVAGEAGCDFFTASGADFTEIYVGVGAKRVRELFAKAKKSEKAIIFIDEIDAMAKKRSDSANGGDSERDSTLIALLNEMDGFHASNVVVLAATNRPDILDPAVMRPGRFDRRVEVPLPDRRARQKIIEVHASRRPVTDDVDFELLGRRTPGMSGAELSQIVNEACIEAARRGDVVVNADCFEHAIATVSMGRARHSAVVTDADRMVTAWHEAGHTVCAYVQEAADKPVSVSIIPRGPAGGVTWMSEGDEQFMKRSKAKARLVTALGGRAAEHMLLGDDFTQGAYGDLMSATELATNMAARFGMTDLGLMVRDPDRVAIVNNDLHVIVESMLVKALEDAQALLEEHRPFVERLVAELLEHETLDAEQIQAVFDEIEVPARERPEYKEFVPAPIVAEGGAEEDNSMPSKMRKVPGISMPKRLRRRESTKAPEDPIPSSQS